jgi:adenine-specific DNA-methyltransferase
MARTPTPKSPKSVETLNHNEATRKNIATAELQNTLEWMEEKDPQKPAIYHRARPLEQGHFRERDMDQDPQIIWNGMTLNLSPSQIKTLSETGRLEIGDAQLTWRGKDAQDWSDLVVAAPPLYIQEKIHPKAIIDDIKRAPRAEEKDQIDLFADFNGIDPEARTEFYQHDQHWSNRMILGDSLQVMASLAERESLKGKVQCIYFDPPYGIKFNSNWQVSTKSKKVEDGKQRDISREPEQVKAFRDTWKDGIHSYLTYLRDRLTVMRELLAQSGSLFVQISDENVHHIRGLMDEIFGAENFVSEILVKKTGGLGGQYLDNVFDIIVWYSKKISTLKYRSLFEAKKAGEGKGTGKRYDQIETAPFECRSLTADEKASNVTLANLEKRGGKFFQLTSLNSDSSSAATTFSVQHDGAIFSRTDWKTNPNGMQRLQRADRVRRGDTTIRFKRFLQDFTETAITNFWEDTKVAGKIYVVQTAEKVIERCILMATDPGDLVLDPTCGSGTTATVAEQWGRRWITIDTSRVALALARTRLMRACYPYYLIADSPAGRAKEQERSGRPHPLSNARGDIRQGFVYERVPHVTLRSIANNTEIDDIWDKWEATLAPLREQISAPVSASSPNAGAMLEEYQIPREAPADWPLEAKRLLPDFWTARITRQKEIDASIAKRADVELLYDRPYEDKTRVRVAGPFTVESLSPHRVIPSGSELSDDLEAREGKRRRSLASAPPTDFTQVVLENLKTHGVQQGAKGDRIVFTSLTPWPGEYIGAVGEFDENGTTRRAGIFIGPEFGTVSRPDLTAAAREASDVRFDVLIAVAFAFEAHASELVKLGPLPVLKAKMNPDMHMAGDLKNTGKGNLFIVFGEPDIELQTLPNDQISVRVLGVDVFDPNTGDVRSGDTKSIAAWFIDTDYDEESFFVRHAYFLGAGDPYKSLKTALKAEIDEAAWATLYRDVSRPFARPRSGRIAVKVINHFGDEVMKVFGV